MSLNVKDEHVHDLVRRAAARTGLSQTRVVERAAGELPASLEAEGSGFRELLGRRGGQLSAPGISP